MHEFDPVRAATFLTQCRSDSQRFIVRVDEKLSVGSMPATVPLNIRSASKNQGIILGFDFREDNALSLAKRSMRLYR